MQRKHIIAAFIVLIVATCSKSDDDGPSNSFVTKGQTFELSDGFVSDELDGTYQVILGNGLIDTISPMAGSQGILFLFRSPEDSVLVPGKYIYSDQDSMPSHGFKGMVYLYDSAFFEIDSGSVVINNQGDSWNLDINARYNNLQSLSGVYNGPLTELDSILFAE